jgi:hypothetical protein
VAPVEVVTDRAPTYPRVLDEMLPAAWHDVERYANNRVEADHAQLKRRRRPMRGIKTMTGLRILAAGHAFIALEHRGHARPTMVRLSPVKRSCREDQVIGRGEREILECRLHSSDCFGHVFAQFPQHCLIWIRGGHRDSTTGEHACGFARARADFQSCADCPTCVGEYLINEFVGVTGSEPFVGRRH